MVKIDSQQTNIGTIPLDWTCNFLGKIADIKTGPFGSVLHAKDYVISGVPIITVEHLGEFGVKHTDLPLVSKEDYKRLRSYKLHTGDIVFSRVGSVDRNALIAPSEDGWLFSGRLLRLRTNKSVFSRFLSYYFHFHPTIERIKSIAVGQTMPSLNTRLLKGVEVALPPPNEQKAIAEALSDIDRLIVSTEKLIAKKKAIKQGLMEELLTGKRRLPGCTDDWEKTSLAKCLAKIVGGGTPSRKNEEYWNGNIPWATVKDFSTFRSDSTQEKITLQGLVNSASHLIPAGTLIIATRMNIGQVSIYNVDVAINQDLKALFPTRNVCAKYLFYLLISLQQEIESLGTGSTVNGIRVEQLRIQESAPT